MKRKAIALLLAAGMLLWTAAPAFAATETREISAVYSGITLYLDLEPVTLLDANGNAVAPFIADGTTYLPVRAISEALDMDVAWDADTSSVLISEKSAPADEAAEADKTPAADEPADKEADATEPADKEADATDEEAPASDTAAADDATVAPESFIGTKALSVTYKDIAIYVNDVKIAPKDAAGNAVEPFIADGTTYLPVRAVAEALKLTVSWDNATKSVYVGEQPEKAAAADSDDDANAVYDKYFAAADAINKADSYAADFSSDIDMTEDGKTTQVKVSGSIEYVLHSDTDIEFLSDTATSVAGQDVKGLSYFKDGYLYTEAAGEKFKMALDLSKAIAQAQSAGVTIEKDAIKAQSADGNTLKFTLDGNKLSDATNSVLNGLQEILPSEGTYTIGDAVCTAVLDDEGSLKSIEMSFSMELTLAGKTTKATSEVAMTYTQIGGVKITAPTDLADYKELDSETGTTK